MSQATEESDRRLLRARDAMDGTYAQPLDVAALARIAVTSQAHFSRTFRDTFGETPHRYLQRRRVERAMFLLRRTFRDIVGATPTEFRQQRAVAPVPSCFAMAWTRPSSFGEARGRARR